MRGCKHCLLPEGHVCWTDSDVFPWNTVLTSETAAAQGGEPIEEISQAIETPIREDVESVKVCVSARLSDLVAFKMCFGPFRVSFLLYTAPYIKYVSALWAASHVHLFSNSEMLDLWLSRMMIWRRGRRRTARTCALACHPSATSAAPHPISSAALAMHLMRRGAAGALMRYLPPSCWLKDFFHGMKPEMSSGSVREECL